MLIMRFKDAAPLMQAADGVGFLGDRLWSRGIEISSKSNFSHYGMIGTAGVHPIELIEVVEHKGGQAIDFAAAVAEYPRQYVWFPVGGNGCFPNFDRALAESEARKYVGIKYGWSAIRVIALWNLPVIRLFKAFNLDTLTDDGKIDSNKPPFCSMAVWSWWKVGGAEAVCRIRRELITPGDLVRSPFTGDGIMLVP